MAHCQSHKWSGMSTHDNGTNSSQTPHRTATPEWRTWREASNWYIVGITERQRRERCCESARSAFVNEEKIQQCCVQPLAKNPASIPVRAGKLA